MKNKQICLASKHKRDTQRDSWRPAMSQHPSLTPVCYLLGGKLNLTLAPALICFLCQGFFYSYTSSIHLFILIHAPSFRRQSKRGGKKIYECMYVGSCCHGNGSPDTIFTNRDSPCACVCAGWGRKMPCGVGWDTEKWVREDSTPLFFFFFSVRVCFYLCIWIPH